MTPGQVWASIGGLGVLLLVALIVLGWIATSVPHLVDQRELWERTAKRHSESARQWRQRAEEAERYAALFVPVPGSTPPVAVRQLIEARPGPISRRAAGGQDVSSRPVPYQMPTQALPEYRQQADDPT